MNSGGPRTVYPCKEFGAVAVPVKELLRDGELEVYPEIAGRGLFDIDYRRGELILRATRFVGLIPITDRVAIHVIPRVPIPNLVYLLWRSGGAPRVLEGFVRGYACHGESVDSPEDLYRESFLSALRRIGEAGILKKYSRSETCGGLRGRFLASASVMRSFAKGCRHRPYFEVHEFGSNCVENQIVRATAERLAGHGLSRSVPRTEQVEFARLLIPFASVETSGLHPGLIARTAPPLVRAIPARHEHYQAALWLAWLLATSGAVSLQSLGGARFETVVVDLSQVFERYVRRLCSDAEGGALSDYHVVDGNVMPVELFVEGVRAETKPDIYILRNGAPVAVMDAKYKPRPSAQDRYELLGFCEALGVKRAAFICPASGESVPREIYGVTRSGVRISSVKVRLHSQEYEEVEREFLAAVADFLAE